MARKYRKFHFLLVSLVLAAAVGVVINVIVRPFPFVRVVYVDNEFSEPPKAFITDTGVDVRIPLPAPTEMAVRRYLATFTDGDDLQRITRATRALMAGSHGDAVRGAADIVSRDARFMNICSEAAKIAAVLAQAMGYPARVVWMDGHTVTSIYAGKWFTLDTYGNVIFRDNAGRALDVSELHSTPSAKARRVVPEGMPGLPEYVAEGGGLIPYARRLYLDQWLYVVFAGEDLFTFAEDSHSLEGVTESVFGIDAPLAAQLDTGPRVGNVGAYFFTRLLPPV